MQINLAFRKALPSALSTLIAMFLLQVTTSAQTNLSAGAEDTLISPLVRMQPPCAYTPELNHSDASIWNKSVRGFAYASLYNIVIGTGLLLSPEQITNWSKKDKYSLTSVSGQYEKTFTSPPVIDKDLFLVNYLGHPYQGSIYYNALRCQGASIGQSAMFSVLNTVIWEYVWEGGMEQPSIQDLIVTPVSGLLLGELCHVLTIKMSHNGFKWYEKAIVCAINPTFVINNGFRIRKK